jgi:hypothetical protein
VGFKISSATASEGLQESSIAQFEPHVASIEAHTSFCFEHVTPQAVKPSVVFATPKRLVTQSSSQGVRTGAGDGVGAAVTQDSPNNSQVLQHI